MASSRHKRCYRDSAIAQQLQGAIELRSSNWNAEGTAHGTTKRLPAERVRGPWRCDERRGTGCLGSADDPADVAGILHVVRDHNKRVRAAEDALQGLNRAARDADNARRRLDGTHRLQNFP